MRRLKPNGLYLCIDIILFCICAYFPYLLRYNKLNLSDILRLPSNWQLLNLPAFSIYSFIFLCWCTITVLVFHNHHLYATSRDITILQETVLVFKALILASLPIILGIFIFQIEFFSRALFITSFPLMFFSFSLWRSVKRILVRKLVSAGFHNVNVLIIGAGRIAKIIADEINLNPSLGLKICGFLDDYRDKNESVYGLKILGKTDDFEKIMRQKFIDEVVISIPSEHKIVRDILEKGMILGVNIKIVPESYDLILGDIKLYHLGIIPLLGYYNKGLQGADYFYKKMLDFIVSSTLLILLTPLFVLVAILIKIDSPGQIFYLQERVGFKGRRFKLYKFRSMVKDADKRKVELMHKNEVKDGIIFKIKKDPRITRVGKFLRKYSIDELPQLINVLKGDMSLVGPRPPTPNEVVEYKVNYLQRLSVNPGITGLAQIKGRSDLTFQRWVRWDCWYIDNWSLMLDLRILLSTMPVVLKAKGAY